MVSAKKPRKRLLGHSVTISLKSSQCWKVGSSFQIHPWISDPLMLSCNAKRRVFFGCARALVPILMGWIIFCILYGSFQALKKHIRVFLPNPSLASYAVVWKVWLMIDTAIRSILSPRKGREREKEGKGRERKRKGKGRERPHPPCSGYVKYGPDKKQDMDDSLHKANSYSPCNTKVGDQPKSGTIFYTK